jgi:hypothetical protein
MDSQNDLLLDSMSMSDASSEASWLRLFLESEASTTNRRFMVRRDDMGVCWEQEMIENVQTGSADFYDADSANLSSLEGRAERESETRSSLDGAMVLDMLTGDASLFHDSLP